MAKTISSTDTTSHAVFAIALLNSGEKVKYPKVKPTGASDANDAAWQTRMTTEVNNALAQTMSGGVQNATATLANLA